MDFDHLFHQPGFVTALQLLVAGSLLAPGVMGRSDLYRLFVAKAALSAVTFGPLGLLGYILYKVSLLE